MSICEPTEKSIPEASDVRLVMLDSWGETQKGTKREENQDAFLNWPEHMVWAVADGVGSSEHGGAASQLITRALMNITEPLSFDSHIDNARRLITEANEILYRQSHSGSSATSTLVCLLIHEGNAACLWSGDSRCYLLRGGTLYQCTKDHTLRQQKIDSGELTPNEAERMVKGNLITNCIGAKDSDFLDEVRFSVHAGDRFLLCSDGLTGLVGPETLSNVLASSSSRRCVDKIMEHIAGCEQPDNITVVAVCLSGMV